MFAFKPLTVLVSLLLVAVVSHASALPNSDEWINHSLEKQLDLVGSVSHLTTTVTFSSLIESKVQTPTDSSRYFFTLNAEEAASLSWAKATFKPAKSSRLMKSGFSQIEKVPFLEVQDQGPADNDPQTWLFSVNVPHSGLAAKDAVANQNDLPTLILEATLNHITESLPASIKQTENQFFVWKGDAAIRSPYLTKSGKIRVKCSHPKIIEFQPSHPSVASKAGSIVTFGPYKNVAPHTLDSQVEQGKVHYQHDLPVVSLVSVERTAEVSHWGDNLAIEDRIWLRNDGAKLKGYFSRIEHQMSSFYQKASSHALTKLVISLPPGARDPYFIDQIGNVSTSRFRPSPPNPNLISVPFTHLTQGSSSFLELQPRFPLLGGWNYSFSIGWNMKMSLGGWTKTTTNNHHGSGSSSYIVAIPFVHSLENIAIDTVSTKIILPEGAKILNYQIPFKVDQIEQTIHKTYLDTKGRPSLSIVKSKCSEKHNQLVYVTYQLTRSNHYIKPISCSIIVLVLFLTASLLKRIKFKIE